MIYTAILALIFFVRRLPRNIYFYFVGFILIIVSGFRGVDVGIDTYTYSQIFKTIINQDLSVSFISLDLEKGFVLFNYLVAVLFGDNFQVLLIIASLFFIFTVGLIVYEYSEIAWMSFYLFIALGYYTFGMSGMRQAIAIGFTLLSYHLVKRGKIFISIITFVLAILFHYSAVIFLPIYFIRRLKINNINVLVSLFLIVLIKLYAIYIFSFMNGFARTPYEEVETGGVLMYYFIVITAVFGYYYRVRLNRKDDDLFFMMIATIALWPIAQINQAMFRITFYYSFFIVVFMPNSLKLVEDKRLRLIYGAVYLLVTSYFFYEKVLFDGSMLIPYRLFW